MGKKSTGEKKLLHISPDFGGFAAEKETHLRQSSILRYISFLNHAIDFSVDFFGRSGLGGIYDNATKAGAALHFVKR